MNERLRQLGVTPAKGALVLVLAIGLGVVWGPQLAGLLGGGKPRSPASASRPKRPAEVAASPARRAVASTLTPAPAPTVRDRPLPNIGLAEAISYDPFAPPAWSPLAQRAPQSRGGVSADVTDVQERFEAIRESGVAMILVSGEGHAAQVGGQTLRVGDRVEGFEVIEIRDSEVVFRPVSDPGDDRGA